MVYIERLQPKKEKVTVLSKSHMSSVFMKEEAIIKILRQQGRQPGCDGGRHGGDATVVKKCQGVPGATNQETVMKWASSQPPEGHNLSTTCLQISGLQTERTCCVVLSCPLSGDLLTTVYDRAVIRPGFAVFVSSLTSFT